MKQVQTIRTARQFLLPLLVVIFLTAMATTGFLLFRGASPKKFNGQRAYGDVLAQMKLGPRVTGSAAGIAAGNYISDQLKAVGWSVEFQPFVYQGTSARNIIARANVGQGPVVIVGAHYDSRRRADRDPAHTTTPVPGANDGASGVAVLLELARTLDTQKISNELWLAFFDAEDNGGLDGWDWIVGSTYMANHLTVQPQAMILVDMVGDADQQFYFDSNSDTGLSTRIWATAARLGYGKYFIPEARWAMTDDHIPFAQRGIPSVDIIDFDYPYWHTTADTADKVSAKSLERIGRVIQAFLESPER